MCNLAVPNVSTVGLNTEAVCDAARHEAGQPAYDPTHHTMYVPDGRGASPGVWRISYYRKTHTITVGCGYYNVSVDTGLLAPGRLNGLRTECERYLVWPSSIAAHLSGANPDWPEALVVAL